LSTFILDRANVFYPKSPNLKNHRKLCIYAFDSNKSDDYHRDYFLDTTAKRISFEREFQKAFYTELEENNVHEKLLISSEQSHSRLISKSELLKLKKLLEPYVKEYRVIVYLRAQIDVAVSLYSTLIKIGVRVPKLNEFIDNGCYADNMYYNYENLLHRWAEVFDEDNLIVKLFDPKEFKNGNLIEDFLETIDIDINDAQFEFPQNKNQSLSVVGQKLHKLLNNYVEAFIPNQGWNRRYYNYSKLIRKHCLGVGEKPKRKFAQQVQARFDVSKNTVGLHRYSEKFELKIVFMSKQLQMNLGVLTIQP